MLQRWASVPLWGCLHFGFWCWKVAYVAVTCWLLRGADPLRRQCQVGNFSGVVHLSNNNAGVLRQAWQERKSYEEQKSKVHMIQIFSEIVAYRFFGLLRVSSQRCRKVTTSQAFVAF